VRGARFRLKLIDLWFHDLPVEAGHRWCFTAWLTIQRAGDARFAPRKHVPISRDWLTAAFQHKRRSTVVVDRRRQTGLWTASRGDKFQRRPPGNGPLVRTRQPW